MEGTCIKYAVYVDNNGSQSLHVVVDSLDAAKKEMEPLKGSASSIKIEESTVENFGKENEKTISSKTVETWKKEDVADSEKLSDKSKSDVSAAPIVSTAGAVAATDVAAPDGDTMANGGITEPEEVKETTEEKVKSFMNHYEFSGSLFGISYWIKKEKETEKETEKEPKKELIEDAEKTGDEKDTEQEKGEYITADEFIKKAGSKKIKVDAKDSKVYYMIDESE